MLAKSFKRRILLLYISVVILFLLIFYQLFRLTVRNQEMLTDFAERQHNLVIEIPPERGVIYDHRMQVLATNLRSPSIYAVPRLISKSNIKKLAAILSRILGLDQKYLSDRLLRDKSFVWLKRRTAVKEAEEIMSLENPVLGVAYESKRFYPHSEMLSNILGLCDIDNKGVDGLEMLYERELSGRTGYRYTKRDALGREIVSMEQKLIPAVDGADLILTIDKHIQFYTEQALNEAFLQWKAKAAIAVVMNPKTGEILAMASRPTFDPNFRGKSDTASRRNRPVTDIFEPGSVFKIVTVTGALQEKAIQLTDTFNCEQGFWRARPNRTIHDVHPYGILDVPMVLIKSSNIGTVKIAMKLGDKKLYEYVKKFGFGDKTGIDFPGEVVGIFRPLDRWSKFSITSIPYGQEVAATALQMVRAVSVIANGGYLVKPYLLKEIKDSKGVVLSHREPELRGPIVSPAVAETVKGILERVVSEGTGKGAYMTDIRAGGKTGTSQKLEPNGTYSHSHFIGSFIGFAPVEDPQLAMFVGIDDPHPLYYGGTVAAPVFKSVIERSLWYLGYVPPAVKEGEAAAGTGEIRANPTFSSIS